MAKRNQTGDKFEREGQKRIERKLDRIDGKRKTKARTKRTKTTTPAEA